MKSLFILLTFTTALNTIKSNLTYKTDTEFKLEYLDSKNNKPINSIYFDETFLIKITNPIGTKISIEDLYKLSFKSGKEGFMYDFETLMVNSFIHNKSENTIVLKHIFKYDENVEFTLKGMKSRFNFDTRGNLNLVADIYNHDSKLNLNKNQLTVIKK